MCRKALYLISKEVEVHAFPFKPQLLSMLQKNLLNPTEQTRFDLIFKNSLSFVNYKIGIQPIIIAGIEVCIVIYKKKNGPESHITKI